MACCQVGSLEGLGWTGKSQVLPKPGEESSVDFFESLQPITWMDLRDQWVFESSYCYMSKKYIVACICNHIVILYEIYRISMWLSGYEYYIKTTLQTHNTSLKFDHHWTIRRSAWKKKRFHGLGLPHWRRSAFVLSIAGQRTTSEVTLGPFCKIRKFLQVCQMGRLVCLLSLPFKNCKEVL